MQRCLESGDFEGVMAIKGISRRRHRLMKKSPEKTPLKNLAMGSRPKRDRCLSGPGEVESSAGMRGGNRARYLLETRRGPPPQVQLTFQVVAPPVALRAGLPSGASGPARPLARATGTNASVQWRRLPAGWCCPKRLKRLLFGNRSPSVMQAKTSS